MSRPIVVAVTVFCGLLGGAFASVFWSLAPTPRILAVLAGAIAGAAVALLVTGGERRRTEDEPAAPGPTNPPARLPHPDREAAADRFRLALPLPGEAAGGRDWWAGDPPAGGRGPSRAPTAAPAPPLRGYTAGQVAQCPRCAGFGLDVIRDRAAYRFRCREDGCGCTWTWEPGTPWPPVLVRRAPGGPPAYRAHAEPD